MGERLEILRRFQKCLRRATAASTAGEAEAAEAAARRLMQTHNINALKLTDKSLYDYTTFTDNVLLAKLRDEQIAAQRSAVAANKARSRFKKPRDEARIEQLRMLLNSGLSRTEICDRHSFNQGEISGIIRDYTGAKSAKKYFQDNPKWIEEDNCGRVFYALMTSAKGETA
jgi:hypothetical protein